MNYCKNLSFSNKNVLQRFARGLLCDVFIANRTDFTIGGFPNKAILEYYFLAVSILA